MNTQTRLESFDIYLCSFLLANGAKLEGVERENGRVRFIIQRKEGLETFLDSYWSNQPVAIVPSSLFASLKHLKSLLYSHRES
jgi:hypothetical protein